MGTRYYIYNIYEHIYKLNGCNLSFLFCNLVEIKDGKDPKKKDNLMNPNLLSVFRNVNHVTINVSGLLCSYRFNPLSFLKIINKYSRDIQYEIKTGYYYNWDISSSISSTYKSKGWDMKYNYTMDTISIFANK